MLSDNVMSLRVTERGVSLPQVFWTVFWTSVQCKACVVQVYCLVTDKHGS
jgi:hypothetical protein